MEMDAHQNFMALSQEVAKDFLHTAVFVDEQAYFKTDEKVVKLTTPQRGRFPDNTDIQKEITGQNEHGLDAKKVIDIFASEGIICSVIKPSIGETVTLSPIIKRADVIILDWQIHDDDGDSALDIIDSLLSDSNNNLGLRLIVIYSAEPAILTISEKVNDKLSPYSFKKNGNFTFVKDHSRVSIYCKEGSRVPIEHTSRILKIEEFPTCLASELSEITAGLVSNVALESMSTLRRNTNLILGNLGPEIDSAYLSHRALLPDPDDAMAHLVDILSSEFHSVLENNNVGSKADIDSIAAYLSNRHEGSELKLYIGSKEESIEIDDLIDIEKNSFVNSDWLDAFIKNKSPDISAESLSNKKRDHERKIEKNFTKSFTIDGEDPDISNCKLSSLISLKKRNRYVESPPILIQGTILKETFIDTDDKFWLCILPKCDCVRIEDKRTFLFLPLKVVEGDNKFDLVIEDAVNYTKLRIDYSTYGLTGYNFSLSNQDDSIVKPSFEDKIYYFDADGKRFEWMAELKTNQAQRISNLFAAKLSRVGLDESEWQRRWSGSS